MKESTLEHYACQTLRKMKESNKKSFSQIDIMNWFKINVVEAL